MKILDARTGREMKRNDTIDYGDGTVVNLLNFEPGIFTCRFFILKKDAKGSGPETVYGRISYMHPRYPFERVALFPG